MGADVIDEDEGEAGGRRRLPTKDEEEATARDAAAAILSPRPRPRPRPRSRSRSLPLPPPPPPPPLIISPNPPSSRSSSSSSSKAPSRRRESGGRNLEVEEDLVVGGGLAGERDGDRDGVAIPASRHAGLAGEDDREDLPPLASSCATVSASRARDATVVQEAGVVVGGMIPKSTPTPPRPCLR